MKNAIRKNLISVSCALALVAIGGGVALNAEDVKADVALAPESMMVVGDAELRLKAGDADETGDGLRFVIHAPGATALPEDTTATGTLVIPTALLEGELTVENEIAYNFDTTAAWNVYDDGAYSYAYFWNMSEYSYNVEMTYRGYIVMGGETHYTETATATIAEIALAARENDESSANMKAAADAFISDYDVTFDVGESSSVINAQEVEFGSKANAVADPELEGYTFNGWLLNGEAFDLANDVVKGDITLVADWSINTYSVVYKDSANWNNVLTTETVEHGAKAPERAYTLRQGYGEFLGWFDEDGNAFDFDTPITSDTVLVSKAQTAECLDFTTMKAGYKPLFVKYTETDGRQRSFAIEEGVGLKLEQAWATVIKSINYAEPITLKVGESIVIDVTVKGYLKSGASALSNAGWGFRFYSVEGFTTAASPPPAEQVWAHWDNNNTSDAVVAGHRETYTFTATSEITFKSFELRPYSSQEGFDIIYHSINIIRKYTPTDYMNFNFEEKIGIPTNFTTGTVSYDLAEKALLVTCAKSSGCKIAMPSITLNTGDVITVVVKTAIAGGATPTNKKAEWGLNFTSPNSWGVWIGDYDFTTDTGYHIYTWTVSDKRDGTVLENIHLRPYDANNTYNMWFKSITIQKAN